MRTALGKQACGKTVLKPLIAFLAASKCDSPGPDSHLEQHRLLWASAWMHGDSAGLELAMLHLAVTHMAQLCETVAGVAGAWS